MANPKGAIVIGGHINGLGIIRSLAARKIPTAVILTKPYDFAQHSRHVSEFERAFDLAEQPEQLLEALDRQASQWKGWVLFPVNDEALAAVAQSRNKLESVYPIIAPQNDSIQYFLDKERMLDAAQSIGIPTPRCYGRAVREAADCSDMSFPVIVKPLSGFRFQARFGCKVFVATSRSELKKAIARVEEARIPCQVYDIVPGPDSRVYCHCMYIDANGNLRADITWRKIRQSPPMFGVARVAEVVPNDARMQESTLEFLRQIRFRGIAVAEYKHDPRDGTFRILEINGRSILCNNLLRRAGVDLAGLAWSDYIERCPETARTQHWPGVWINLHADLLYSILRSRKENLALKDFLAPYRRPMIEAVWSACDPKPFLVEWGRTLGKSLRLFG